MLFHIFYFEYYPAIVFDFRNHLSDYDPMERHITLDHVDHPNHRDNVVSSYSITDLINLNFGL